jgi:hypothetical protein
MQASSEAASDRHVAANFDLDITGHREGPRRCLTDP